jgi:UDP-glucose:glycoprotein glucosyltransferase
MGEIDDESAANMSTYFYDLPSSNSRRNRHIYHEGNMNLRITNLLNTFERAGFYVYPDSYVYPCKPFRRVQSLLSSLMQFV